MATDTSAGAPPSLTDSQSQSHKQEQESNQAQKPEHEHQHEHEQKHDAQPQEPVEMTCQCGQISLLLPHPPKRILECQCSICFRYGALWAYYPREKVLVTAAAEPLRPRGTNPTTASEVTPEACIAGDDDGDDEARNDEKEVEKENEKTTRPCTEHEANTKTKERAVSTADAEGMGPRTRKYIREDERMGFLEFHFCSKCGCVTHWWGVERKDGQEKMGVNARMLGMEALRGVKRRVHKGPD